MGTVAALGERQRVQGWALAGVLVVPAEDPQSVRRAWAGLPASTVLVLLTPAAAEALADELDPGALPLTAVLPGTVRPGALLPGAVLPGAVLPGSVPAGPVVPG